MSDNPVDIRLNLHYEQSIFLVNNGLKIVILFISNVFVLCSTNKFKQSPFNFHCTYPQWLCASVSCKKLTSLGGIKNVRFVYCHGLCVQVGETCSLIEKQKLDRVFGVWKASLCEH